MTDRIRATRRASAGLRGVPDLAGAVLVVLSLMACSAEAPVSADGVYVPEAGDDLERFYDRMSAMLANLPTTLLVYSARSFESEPVLFDQKEDAKAERVDSEPPRSSTQPLSSEDTSPNAEIPTLTSGEDDATDPNGMAPSDEGLDPEDQATGFGDVES